jgi:hypothetical protein
MQDDGWEIGLRVSGGSHFVYLEYVTDQLHIIDPWDGERKTWSINDVSGIRAAHVAGIEPEPNEVMVGMHDLPGAEWMVQDGVNGCTLIHSAIGTSPIAVDLRHLQDITIAVRLSYGYADGTGTFPPPEHRESFVNAVVETINNGLGVDYWHIGNEPNNLGEHPAGYTLTPEYVVGIYNDIRARVDAKIGPPPIDPYFGPGSDNSEWQQYIWANIDGADAIFLHAKTQTNDPQEVWSHEKFSDYPLTWQYLHLRTVETSLGFVPEQYRHLPVFVSELNPQHKYEAGGELGWLPENGEWIHQAMAYLRQVNVNGMTIAGAMIYRYELAGDQASFGLANKPVLLNATKEEA